MTNDLAAMLIGPAIAVFGAAVLGTFVMWRIHRYGYVFKSPEQSSHRSSPAIRHGDK